MTDELLPICSQYKKYNYYYKKIIVKFKKLYQLFIRCDFDKSFCDWKNEPGQALNWERITGMSPSPSTGPDRDHTTGFESGSYLFLAPSNSQDANKRSTLLSRNFIQTNTKCQFIFYYYMNGVRIKYFIL